MKYIKSFESIENKRSPKRVSSLEFFSKRKNHKMTDFTRYERETIYKIVSEKGGRCSFSSDFVEIFLNSNSIEIVKYTDDWFTIISEDRWNNNTYYICDEFEEVESYLM